MLFRSKWIMPEIITKEISALLAEDLADNKKISVSSLIKLQNNECRIRDIIRRITEGKHMKYYTVKNGILCREYKLHNEAKKTVGIYVPTSILYSIIIHIHKFYLHPSKTQNLKEFNALYYHPLAKKAVKRVCDSCIICTQSRNPENKNIHVGRERSLKPLKPKIGRAHV